MAGDLDQLLRREIGAINAKLAAHGIDAGTHEDLTLVAGGAFVAYGLSLGRAQKIAGLESLTDDLAVVLSGVRGCSVPVRLRLLPVPALEVPHPRPYPLHWAKARGAVAALQPGELLAGRIYHSGGAADLVVDLGKSPHILIAGITGSGKSTLLQMMGLSLAVSTSIEQIEYRVIDLKNDDTEKLRELPQVSIVACDRLEAGRMIQGVAEEKDRRVGVTGRWPGRRLVLLIDELAELATVPGALDLLGSIVSVGRSKGISVIAATQYPVAKVIGSIAKANFTDRFVGRVADSAQAVVASGRADTGAHLLPGLGSFLSISGPEVARMQAYYMDDAGIDHFLAEARPAWRAAQRGRLPAVSSASPALVSSPPDLTQNVLGVALPADLPPRQPAPAALAPAVPPHVAAVFAQYWDGAELRRPGTVKALRAWLGADNVAAGGRKYQDQVAELQALLEAWAKQNGAAASPAAAQAAGAGIVNMRAYAAGRAAVGA